jgi:hypothetical protein
MKSSIPRSAARLFTTRTRTPTKSSPPSADLRDQHQPRSQYDRCSALLNKELRSTVALRRATELDHIARTFHLPRHSGANVTSESNCLRQG